MYVPFIPSFVVLLQANQLNFLQSKLKTFYPLLQGQLKLRGIKTAPHK